MQVRGELGARLLHGRTSCLRYALALADTPGCLLCCNVKSATTEAYLRLELLYAHVLEILNQCVRKQLRALLCVCCLRGLVLGIHMYFPVYVVGHHARQRRE